MDNQITLLARSCQLDDNTTLSLQSKFQPFLEQAEQRKDDALAIVVTDISQKEEMQIARAMRLEIKAFRGVVETTRKDLKEESLRKGQAIDKVANIIKSIVEPIEEYLDRQEKFALIQEYNRKVKLKEKRLEVLLPYEVTPERLEIVKLDEITDEQFELFRSESEQLQRFRIAEEIRLANEAKEREIENQRIREENAKLQAENQAKDEAIAKANKEIADQVAREAQEAMEQEAIAKAEQEAKLKLQQDNAYKAFLYANGCTEDTKADFTTKRADDGTITLYKKVAEYKIL